MAVASMRGGRGGKGGALRRLLGDLSEIRDRFRASSLQQMRIRRSSAAAAGLDRSFAALSMRAVLHKLASFHGLVRIRGPADWDLLIRSVVDTEPTVQLDLWGGDPALALFSLLGEVEIPAVHRRLLPFAQVTAAVDRLTPDEAGPELAVEVYEGLSGNAARGGDGVFPAAEAERVVRLALGSELERFSPGRLPVVLDPACGPGRMMLAAYRMVFEWLTGAHNVDPDEAHRLTVGRCLWGFDPDPLACAAVRLQLALRRPGCTLHAGDLNIHASDLLKAQDDLLTAMTPHAAIDGRVDLVVGSPPWESTFNREEREFFRRTFRSAATGLNLCALHLERAVGMLAPGGLAGFVVPEALLNASSHAGIRQLLLERSRIEAIELGGEPVRGQIGRSVGLLLRREPEASRRSAGQVGIGVRDREPGAPRMLIPQALFERTPERIFNVHLTDPVVSLLRRIEEGSERLAGRATWGVGIVTGDNGRFIQPRRSSQAPHRIIGGRDVFRYGYRFGGTYFRFKPDQFQQVCPLDVFKAPEKLIYRFVGRRLIFAYDDEGIFTLNNANMVIPEIDGIDLKYLLALFNSSALQFCYSFSFFAPKVLRGALEQLPLRLAPPAELLRQTVEAAGEAIDAVRRGTFGLPLWRRLDDVVAEIYGLNGADRDLVRERLDMFLGQGWESV